LVLKAAPASHKSCEQPESQHAPLWQVPEQHSPLSMHGSDTRRQSAHAPFSQKPEQHLYASAPEHIVPTGAHSHVPLQYELQQSPSAVHESP